MPLDGIGYVIEESSVVPRLDRFTAHPGFPSRERITLAWFAGHAELRQMPKGNESTAGDSRSPYPLQGGS